MMLNLERQIEFYLGFHQNKKNRLIHITSLPFLILTALIFAAYVWTPLGNLALLIVILYQIYVFFLDRAVGWAFLPYAVAQCVGAFLIVKLLPERIVLPVAIVVHLAAWACQLIGHFKFERNRPAMLTSLVHSVLAAPLVTYLEILFSLGLMKETQARVDRARGLQQVDEGGFGMTGEGDVPLREAEYGALGD